MKTKKTNIIMQNKVFIWIAFATLLVLFIPLLLMKFHIQLPDPGDAPGEINWNLFDFIVMGALIFGAGSLFVLAARKIDKKYRIAVAFAFVLGFLWLWAELAVGIFTNWGS